MKKQKEAKVRDESNNDGVDRTTISGNENLRPDTTEHLLLLISSTCYQK